VSVKSEVKQVLTSKQRAHLSSLGNDEQVVLQVGKGGIIPTVIKQADDVLAARELVKIRVLKNCVESPAEIAETLAEAVHAEVVKTIGRNSLLYRQAKKARIELP
jgi:RNA-binding protein